MKSGFARYRPGEIRELPPARRSGSLSGDDPASPPPSRDKGELRSETFRQLPVFVLTHRAHEPIAGPGGSTFTFVSGGTEIVLAQARTAASGRDVVLIGGASLGRQFVKAGLVDEMRIHLVHLLLGTGARLFDLAGDAPWPLQTTRLVEDAGVTHFLVPTSPRPRG
jgi:dihydrofolate reductase